MLIIEFKNYFHAPYSPSQLELAKRCKRRWAFTYRKGLRSPSNKAAEAGTRVHGVLEVSRRDGTPIDTTLFWNGYPIGVMAAAMSSAAPLTSDTVFEGDFTYEYGPYKFTGRIDERFDGTIRDWKTTSKPAYAKSPAKLQSDIQAVIYAYHPAVFETGPALEWIYGIWSTGKVKKVKLRLTTDEAANKMGEIVVPVVESIHDIPANVNPLDLEPNWDDCGMYPPTGCEHKATCGEKPRTGFGMDILNHLREVQGPLAPIIHDLSGAAPAVAETEEASVGARVMPPGYKIGTLYADCLPLERSYTFASRLMAAAAEEVCADAHIHHVRLADFSKGGPMLAAQLVANINAGDFIEALVLETRTPEGRECFNALVGISQFVVKGM